MAKGKILVVDDEEEILELVQYNLTKEGYEVIAAGTGELAVDLAEREAPNLLVLDLMLPGMDGLDVCRTLKGNKKTAHIPIMMLTARSAEADIVTGLELGADDYLVKPFSPRVLIARVKTLLRRTKETATDTAAVVRREELLIDPARHEVKLYGRILDLTSTEFKLLHFLASRPGLVYTRQQIVDAIHGEDYPVTDRSIDVQVVGLRKKLVDYGRLVETVRGVGYRFRG